MYKKDNAASVPVHANVVRNFANVEIFDSGDENEEDCLGWITIMEKCETDLWEELKNRNPGLEKRKKIAKGIQAGLKYLEKVGIGHCDRKLANFLLIGDVAKVCDFGIIYERSRRKSYRKLGYARRGPKYRHDGALCMFCNI
jgi:serine/threonine protein kinase